MADWSDEIWQEIKTEFMTKGTSFRKLSEKYGPNKDTIWKRAKDEDWDRQRRQHSDNVQTKILDADIELKVSRAEKLNEAADMLLGRVMALLGNGDPLDMDTQGMKHISGVLKDVKEIYMVKAQKDLEEQDARIAKLRKEAEKEEQNHDVTITIAGGDPSWQS